MNRDISPDPAYLRNREAYHHLVHTLSLSLPPPPDGTPEALALRNTAAIAQVAALCPANAAEATLAAQFVAAHAQAMDCLRLTHTLETPGHLTLKCNAQAALMMRQSQGAMRMLLRTQAARQARDANPAAAGAAAWTEHAAAELMIEKLTHPLSRLEAPSPQPESPGIPSGEPPSAPLGGIAGGPVGGIAGGPVGGIAGGPVGEPPLPRLSETAGAPTSEPVGGRAGEPLGEPPSSRLGEPISETAGEFISAAEAYVALYPQRAALIRRLGGVPDNVQFGPPDEDVVRALVTGRSPALAALDLVAIRN